MSAISIFAPAKLNLFLAVTGRRGDGFHDLVSVVAPLDFGDTLRVGLEQGAGNKAPEFSLACDNLNVPLNESNLVLKAAAAFAEAAAETQAKIRGARFFLEKRIPIGAGLGGGSSNAVAALKALNALTGEVLSEEKLHELAARLGSDCPLFLRNGPVVMRGRGEQVATLPANALSRLRGRRVLVFKPAFGISTPWAYAAMAAKPETYLLAGQAEARLAAWVANPPAPLEELLFNNLEQAAWPKFLALPALLDRLRTEFGVAPRMSGSGSACFVLLREETDVEPMVAKIRAAWGESAFIVETRLASFAEAP